MKSTMTPKEMIAVMEAFNDGKDIQFIGPATKEWTRASSPCWNFTKYTYRVKPEPRVRYFIELGSGDKVVKFVEVIDE